MAFPKNHFGVPQYPSTDTRRLFVLLGAIDLLERPTVSAIADLTSHDRDTIDQEVNRLREEFGVSLHKVGEVYHIESWGKVLNPEGVKGYLRG
ncbi:hypothetical protein SAMN06265795_1029 [Noviherbaspirillum humi]|uniref:Helix-turn-helix domain-containing protein n=1 Tax=Noviherbaspirillum humi TaxID=1688639 RepID=A0A239D6L5_9BURK|nr:hypothetical protein [Noviherbaspirillum humi]SNS27504.1 hypothetical protein SAMN06265795_1029 [Noviherbaspirillum humi]